MDLKYQRTASNCLRCLMQLLMDKKYTTFSFSGDNRASRPVLDYFPVTARFYSSLTPWLIAGDLQNAILAL